MWWRVRRFGGELLGRLKYKKRNIDYTGESNFFRDLQALQTKIACKARLFSILLRQKHSF